MKVPLAIRYLRARASFYTQIRAICKKLRRSAYAMMCKHFEKALAVSLLCKAKHDCDKCEYQEECGTRFDTLIDIG